MNSQGDLGILKVLTENPEFMQKAMSIASSLASSGALSGMGISPVGSQGSVSPPAPTSGADTGIASLLSALGAGRTGEADKAQPQQMALQSTKHTQGASHRDRIRLLEAMRPFVPAEKREKLEFVIRLLGLIQVADQLGLKNMIEGR